MPLAIISLAALTLILLGWEWRLRRRFRLGAKADQEHALWFYNGTAWQEDSKEGFRYLPNTQTTGVLLHKGKPVWAQHFYINQIGNCGQNNGAGHASASIRISVYGDSFAQYTGGIPNGCTFADELQLELEKRTGDSVSALSFGRDGYGILQMVDLMGTQEPVWKSQHIVLAFITEDLDRGRLWRRFLNDEGIQRLLVANNPEALNEPSLCADGCLFVDGFDAEDAKDWLRAGELPGEIQDKVQTAFRSVKAKRRKARTFFGIDYCCVLNQVKHGDPFLGLEPVGQVNPALKLGSYDQDEALVGVIQELRERGVQIHLVHIPQYHEMQAVEPVRNLRQDLLLRSLEKVTGSKVQSLFDAGQPPLPIDELVCSPHDLHPSPKGLHWIGQRLADLLEPKLASTALQGS